MTEYTHEGDSIPFLPERTFGEKVARMSSPLRGLIYAAMEPEKAYSQGELLDLYEELGGSAVWEVTRQNLRSHFLNLVGTFVDAGQNPSGHKAKTFTRTGGDIEHLGLGLDGHGLTFAGGEDAPVLSSFLFPASAHRRLRILDVVARHPLPFYQEDKGVGLPPNCSTDLVALDEVGLILYKPRPPRRQHRSEEGPNIDAGPGQLALIARLLEPLRGLESGVPAVLAEGRRYAEDIVSQPGSDIIRSLLEKARDGPTPKFEPQERFAQVRTALGALGGSGSIEEIRRELRERKIVLSGTHARKLIKRPNAPFTTTTVNGELIIRASGKPPDESL
jgi:hypothetical protein